MTAAWHEEVAGARDELSKEVGAAWLKLLGCLAALTVLAMALPGPGDLATAVVDALTGGSPGAGAAGRGEVAITPPAFLDIAQDAVLLAAGVIVWALLLWGLAVVITAGAGRLPGASGKAARKVLRRIAPAAAGRLVIAAVGVTAIAGVSACAAPDGSAAATVADANAVVAPASTADPSAPSFDIDWPDAPVSGTAGATPTPAATPTGGPAAQSEQASAPTQTPTQTPAPTPAGTSPAAVATTPSISTATQEPTTPSTTEPDAAPARARTTDGPVTVRPGDTLWAIAAHHLPADATDVDIDTTWRAWYSANAELIGTDPDLIIPGQQLLPGHPETRPSS